MDYVLSFLQGVPMLNWALFAVMAAVVGRHAVPKAMSLAGKIKLPSWPTTTNPEGKKPSREQAFKAVETLVDYFPEGSTGRPAAITCGQCLFTTRDA